MTTIRIGYTESEDRALVAFIGSDAATSFVVTRRMMRHLINGIAQLLARSSRAMARAPVDVKIEVLIFEHQSAVQTAAPLAPPERSAAGECPAPAPELLAKIDVDIQPLSFRLTFTGCSGTIQRLNISRPELHRLLASLHKIARTAGWNLENEVGWLKEADAPYTPPSKAAS